MKTLLGDGYGDFLNAYTETPVRAFRVNTDKISVVDFLKINPFNIEKIPYVPNGFYFTDEKISPVSQKIIDDVVNDMFPSDHYGLYIKIEI
jgi:hypothetical protein